MANTPVPAPEPTPVPPDGKWLGMPSQLVVALWHTLLMALVAAFLGYMAQRNHTATVDNTEAVKVAAVEAKDAAVEAKTTAKESKAAIQKTTEVISAIPDVREAMKKAEESKSE